jgi:hypothetical protein
MRVPCAQWFYVGFHGRATGSRPETHGCLLLFCFGYVRSLESTRTIAFFRFFGLWVVLYSRLRRIAAGAVPIDLPRGFELFEKLLRV